VSTTLGAEGVKVTHGHDILLADTPQDFAESVVRLLEQPDLRAKLGGNGRQLAEQEYDWICWRHVWMKPVSALCTNIRPLIDHLKFLTIS